MTQIVTLDGNSAASWGGAKDEDVLRKAYASLLGFYISPVLNPEYKLAMTVDTVSQNGTVTVTPSESVSRNNTFGRTRTFNLAVSVSFTTHSEFTSSA